jgi:eukaryotic-like serine/threonine-protein kinase
VCSAEGEQPEERLAEALAAFDDRLAAGITNGRDERDQHVDPALFSDWNQLTAFLSLVEKAWPRGDRDSDNLASSELDYQTEPAPAQGASIREDALTAAPDAKEVHRFGRFQILRTLGQGGVGIVFLAWDPALRRQIALKVPQPETLMTNEARKRFQREAHAAAGLDHPNIVPVYETGSIGSVTYIAAAYCPGSTLADWLARQSLPVPVRDAAALTATLARAVEHAHERGVLHRDLKPSNILLKHSEAGDLRDDANEPLGLYEPRITDFSLAKIAGGLGPETKSGVPFGSPPYMAPEQAEGKLKAIGSQTDVYGLGCILYELLTGKAPFRGDGQLDILRQVIADAPIPPRRARKDTPIELEAIVLKCLEKNPARRYPSAREMADDVDRFLAGQPTRARPPGRWEQLAQRTKKHSAALSALALVTGCAITLLLDGRWYEARLQTDRRLTLRKNEETRVREVARGRRLQYVRDIRQADQLLRSFQAALAMSVLNRQRPQAGEDDLREFTWYHLMRRCDTASRTLRGHQSDVYSVEFSPRGDLLASAGKDGAVVIWDTSNWHIVRKIVASYTEVNAAAFSPDGQNLATVDDHGELRLWEIATGEMIFERPAHKGEATVARFTPSGKTIVTAGTTDGIKLWDRETGDEVDRLSGQGAMLSPDGAILAMSAKDGEIELWDLSTRTLIKSLPVAEELQGAAFSHDGKKLATAHAKGRLVQFWDIDDGRLLHEFRGHADAVSDVVFSPDDQSIISASRDATIRFWSVSDRMQNGHHLGHAGRIWNLALSPDGRQMASAGSDGTVKLWDAALSRGITKIPIDRHPFSFTFMEDSRNVMTLDVGDRLSIARWDVPSASLLKRLTIDLPGRSKVYWLAVSNDGRRFALVRQDGSFTLWNTATLRQERLIYSAAPDTASYAAFSPDDRYLLIQYSVARRALWDLVNQRLIPVPWDKIESVHFAAAGEVEVLLEDGHLICWNPSTGRTKSRSFSRPCQLVKTSFSRDGRFLASVDPKTWRILLWSAPTLELMREFPGHGVACRWLAFSPDQKTLASAGDDRMVKLWDVDTGEELITLEKYGSVVDDPRFSPDGRTLVTTGSIPAQMHELFFWRTASDAPEPPPQRNPAASSK